MKKLIVLMLLFLVALSGNVSTFALSDDGILTNNFDNYNFYSDYHGARSMDNPINPDDTPLIEIRFTSHGQFLLGYVGGLTATNITFYNENTDFTQTVEYIDYISSDYEIFVLAVPQEATHFNITYNYDPLEEPSQNTLINLNNNWHVRAINYVSYEQYEMDLISEFNRGYTSGYNEALFDDDGTGFGLGWVMSLLSLFTVIFAIELLPNFTIGMIAGIPIVFGIFLFFLKLVRG